MGGLVTRPRLGALALQDLVLQTSVVLEQLFHHGLHAHAAVVQLEKHTDLGQQNDVVDRLGDVVDRAGAIALEAMQVVGGGGGDEDDRRAARGLILGEQRGHLETVHLRHVDVQQDQCELVVQAGCQGRIAGLRLDKVDLHLGQQAAHRHQVGDGVVDDENLRPQRLRVQDWRRGAHRPRRVLSSTPICGGGST